MQTSWRMCFKRHSHGRLHADRAHHGQLPGHCGGARISERGPRAVRQVWRRSADRRSQDRLPGGPRRSAGTLQVKADLSPSPRRSAMATRSRCSPAARRSCASSARASRTAAPTRRTPCRSRPPTSAWRSSTRPMRSSASRTYGTRMRGGMRAVLSARGIAHSFVGHPSMPRPLFRRRAAAQLPRLEEQRLLLLRCHGAGSAR